MNCAETVLTTRTSVPGAQRCMTPPLDQLLPEPPAATMPAPTLLCRRSAWTSTLTAGLELAKQGDVVLAQKKRSGKSTSAQPKGCWLITKQRVI